MEGQRNRHPADELADVRTEIKALQERESRLRAALLDGDCGPEGDDFVARFVTLKQSRLDVEEVKKHFGMATLKPFFTDKEVQQVRLEARSPGRAKVEAPATKEVESVR
jgi:hypothetical protein